MIRSSRGCAPSAGKGRGGCPIRRIQRTSSSSAAVPPGPCWLHGSLRIRADGCSSSRRAPPTTWARSLRACSMQMSSPTRPRLGLLVTAHDDQPRFLRRVGRSWAAARLSTRASRSDLDRATSRSGRRTVLTGWATTRCSDVPTDGEHSDRRRPLPRAIRAALDPAAVSADLTPSLQGFVDAAVGLGLPSGGRLQRSLTERRGGYPLNAVDGVRQSTAVADLTDDVRRRPNLAIRGDVNVDRVAIRGMTATG